MDFCTNYCTFVTDLHKYVENLVGKGNQDPLEHTTAGCGHFEEHVHDAVIKITMISSILQFRGSLIKSVVQSVVVKSRVQHSFL